MFTILLAPNHLPAKQCLCLSVLEQVKNPLRLFRGKVPQLTFRPNQFKCRGYGFTDLQVMAYFPQRRPPASKVMPPIPGKIKRKDAYEVT